MKAQSIGTMAAWCGVCLIQSVMAEDPAAADSAGTRESEVVTHDDWPVFEASVDFCTRQLTYGLVDNRDPIVTAAVAAGWHGFTFESALVFDTTAWGETHGGYGDRKGRYQELAFGPGYTYTFDPDDVPFLPTAVETFVNYVYEYHPPVRESRGESNPDTQFVNLGFALPDLWLAPILAAEIDLDNEAGAVYLLADIGHSFTLVESGDGREGDTLALTMCAGVGFGNAKRNRYDAGFDACALKDFHATVSLDWQITDGVLISPYVAVYEQIHPRLREAARHALEGETHASTQLVGGLALVALF